jgi:hypothetical protein
MRAASRRRRLGALAAAAGVGLLAAGCLGTRQVSTPVYDRGEIRSYVRATKRGSDVVPRGFSHPAVIASVRLAHALSFIDVELGEGRDRQRIGAVHPAIIYEVADALEAALAEAGPDQEVVVMALRREKRLGIFHADFLTSFIAYVKGDLLTVHFGHTNWEVPKIEGGGRGEPPMPKEGRVQMKFRILPGPAVTLLGPQTAALDWKSPRFDEPARIQLGPGGEVRRRTILMEEEAPEAPSPPEATLPIDRLEPDTLRALADLEEQRRRGEITEGEYQVRRRELLAGDPATP